MKDMSKDNKKILVLACIIIVAIGLIYFILQFIGGGNNLSPKEAKETVDKALTIKDEQIIYIENSDSKKCEKCSKIKKYLDDEGINYVLYDVNNYSKKEYEETLKKLTINPSDFGYPAVIYVRDGIMYSNIINIPSTDTVKQFIKDYNLKKVKNDNK